MRGPGKGRGGGEGSPTEYRTSAVLLVIPRVSRDLREKTASNLANVWYANECCAGACVLGRRAEKGRKKITAAAWHVHRKMAGPTLSAISPDALAARY